MKWVSTIQGSLFSLPAWIGEITKPKLCMIERKEEKTHLFHCFSIPAAGVRTGVWVRIGSPGKKNKKRGPPTQLGDVSWLPLTKPRPSIPFWQARPAPALAPREVPNRFSLIPLFFGVETCDPACGVMIQSPVFKWSTQNHVKNQEGGYPSPILGLGLSLTFTYPGFDCDAPGTKLVGAQGMRHATPRKPPGWLKERFIPFRTPCSNQRL